MQGHFLTVKKVQMVNKKVAVKHCGHNMEMTDIMCIYDWKCFIDDDDNDGYDDDNNNVDDK